MLIQIPLLSFLLFGACYPLFFWLTAKDPIKHNFHRFHLGCPVFVGGMAVAGLWLMPVDQSLKNAAALWVLGFLAIAGLFWNKENVRPLATTLISLWGLKLFAAVYAVYAKPDILPIAICIFSGLAVSAAFYAMNLGHFYLNVHGLNIAHLKNAVTALAVILAIRLIWNIYYLTAGQVLHGGEMIPMGTFINSLDGFLLWIAVFFGTVFPLGGLYFAFGTLKLKNTQATTGILYALLSAILLGDLAYKYYLLKFSIPL